MQLDDLSVQNQLVDVNTGEVIGYTLISPVGRVVALTKSKILDMKMDLANYIDYVGAEALEVISNDKYYFLAENKLYDIEEYEDAPYKTLSDNKVSIWGNVVNRYHLIELNNEQAIKNVLLDVED